MKKLIKKLKKKVKFPINKYDIIYADPPWIFKTYSDKGKDRSAEVHYACMTLEDIKKLPVNNIASDNCILFMWVTFPMLEKGLEVIKAWGFTYKTCAFNWIKQNKKSDTYFWGLGYWTRSNSEICLLATKGKPHRISTSVFQIVDFPEDIVSHREEHSKKPDIVRDRIVELCGDLPRIELFARQKAEGWDSWGDEV
jgi:N6-adenosine-specific RNA methylase IME4